MGRISIRVAALACFVLVGNCTINAEELSKAEIAARDYSYKTATFGMRLEDFENQFPVGLPTVINPSKNLVRHRLKLSPHRHYVFSFQSNRISQIIALISKRDIEKIGGMTALLNQMVNKFGRPQAITEGVTLWHFPKVNRRIAITEADGSVIILFETIQQKIAENAPTNEIADAHLGF